MKSFERKKWQNSIGAVILVLAVLTFGFCIYQMQVQAKRREKAVIQTKVFLRHLSLYVTWFTTDSVSHLVPESMPELLQWLAQRDSDFEKELNAYKVPGNNDQPPYDLERGLLYDYWGNPIRFAKTDATHCQFISLGPNGRDDQGGKDDIIYAFETY